MSARTEYLDRIDDRLVRRAGSCAAAALYVATCFVHLRAVVEGGGSSSLLFLIQISIVAWLFICRRPAKSFDTRPLHWMAATGATFGPFLLQPGQSASLLVSIVAVPLQLAGIVFSLAALWRLGKSFGVVAADRGLVTSGPYGVVRHPAYLGYLLSELGFFIMNPSPYNALLLAVVWMLQLSRIVAEERVLSADPAYVDYTNRVAKRLIPAVW